VQCALLLLLHGFGAAAAQPATAPRRLAVACQSELACCRWSDLTALFDSLQCLSRSCPDDIRPSASVFSLIKFRSGGHSLRVETDRWLRPKPPREQRICCHCSMQAVEDEQHFLFDCPFYSLVTGQHFSLFGPNYQQRDLRLFFEQNSHQLGFVAHHIHLCFQARMPGESQLAPLATPQTVRC